MITTLEKEMADIQSVTIKLQENNINLYDVRVLFDGLISRFPKMDKYLSKSSKIIQHKGGVVGAFNGSVTELSAGEIAAIDSLKLSVAIVTKVSNNFAEELLSQKASKHES